MLAGEVSEIDLEGTLVILAHLLDSVFILVLVVIVPEVPQEVLEGTDGVQSDFLLPDPLGKLTFGLLKLLW